MTYRFGDFELSRETYELRRFGERIRVEPRVFEVLAYLVAHRDRVVPKEELLEKLWPDRFVSDSALARVVRDVRRALGDTGARERFVQTIHGRGFRFAGEVRESGTSSPPSAPPSRQSLVVLPLVDLSADPERAFFADGMTEALTTVLAGVASLKVISRTSAMRYKDTRKALPEIASELGVDYAVEGSVQSADGRIRITAQLLRARDEEHLWAESYDRELTDIFAIQSDVALKIAGALRAALSPDERRRLAQRPTVDLQAYQLYLQGRFALGRYTEQGFRGSLEYLERAVARAPGFALAHAAIARLHVELANEGFDSLPPIALYERARAAIAAALALDDELGEAHGIAALLAMYLEFDWVAAERGFERALLLSPGAADVYDHYGWLCSFHERWDDALRLTRRARELDPLAHPTDVATVLLRMGRYEEAIESAREAVELDTRFARAHSALGWGYLLSGRVAEGIAELERAVELTPGGTQFRGQLGQAWALAGDVEKAQSVRDELLALRAHRYVSPYHLAYVCAGLDADEAVAWLERAYDDRVPAIGGIRSSFLFTRLHGHPGFDALLRKMNLR